MKILFLTNLLPYPLDNGGKIKTYTTLKSLKSAGNEIDLICFTEDDVPDVKNGEELKQICSSVTQIPWKITTSTNKAYMIKIAAKSLFSKYSFGLLKYISPPLIDHINKIKSEKKYDCIYFDHLQMCVYYDIVKSIWADAEFILDEHNCEYVIMQRHALNSENILKKLFLQLETKKLKNWEKEWLTRFDKIFVLSNEDDRMLKSVTSSDIKTVIVPIGINYPEKTLQIKDDDLDTVNILFVGTLTWAPNNNGIVWFVKDVIPQLKEKGFKIKLTIVGKNPGNELVDLAKDLDEVEITGYVESVFPYYEKCDCMIVPLFVGSGQRVKIIEGFSLGMPIISTSIGAEGLKYIDGENILIADNDEEFIEKISLMKNGALRKKLSDNAKAVFNDNYSIDSVKKLICDTVNNS